MIILRFFIGVLTGIISGFGIGGGTLLMLYLTAFAGTPQRVASGINLLYFLFCAPAALFSHIKNKLIERKVALLCIAAGTVTSIGAAFLAQMIHADWLRRLFGVLLLYVGCRELFAKKTSSDE